MMGMGDTVLRVLPSHGCEVKLGTERLFVPFPGPKTGKGQCIFGKLQQCLHLQVFVLLQLLIWKTLIVWKLTSVDL